jgi:hypothetical protein
MKILNYIMDNDYVIYALFTTTVGFIGYKFISSYINSTVIETPNSPPTFNFSLEQLKEVQDILDRGDQLDQEVQDNLDQDLQTIMGEDLYNQFQTDLQAIENEFNQGLQELLNNEFPHIHCPLELIDITNLIPLFYQALGILTVITIFV